MKQQILAMAIDQSESFERYRRPTRRDEFRATMDRIVPWTELCAVIEPHHPKAGTIEVTAGPSGRPPRYLNKTCWESCRSCTAPKASGIVHCCSSGSRQPCAGLSWWP